MAIYLPRAVADAAKRLADEREAERRRQDALNAPPPVAPPPPRFTSVPQPAAPRFAMPSGPPTGPGVAPLPAGGGFLGGIADAWRGAVPQGVRDTLGAVGQSRVVQEQLEQTGRLFEHIGRPAGAVTAALAGESPSASARGLVEGFRDPVAGVQRGRDIGFVRNLSDDPSASPAFGAGAFGLPGLALGKVAERFGVSPREAVGAAVPIIADPLNFVPGLGPTRQIVRASRGANRAVGRGAVASTLGRGAANERAPEALASGGVGIRDVVGGSSGGGGGAHPRGSGARVGLDDLDGAGDTAGAVPRGEVDPRALARPAPAARLQPEEVIDLLIPGEKPSIGVLRRYEGAVNTQALAIRRDFDAGNRALGKMRIGRATGTSRNVDRSPDVEQLYAALHGEATVPPSLQGVFDDLKGAVDAETAQTLDFNPKFMAVPDYFPRGWKEIEVSPPSVGKVQNAGSGQMGATPGFAKPRVDETFSEILAKNYTRPDGSTYRLEPASWNPYEQLALRRVAGAEYREQAKLIERMKGTGVAVVADGPLPQGYRVPRVGPAFEGKPKIAPSEVEGQAPSFFGYTDRYAVPDNVADVLENMYGQRVSLGKGIEAVLRQGMTAKRAKLFGSLFQQVDFSTRTGFASFGGALDSLLAGHPVESAAKLAKLPADLGKVVASNLSPNRRALLRDEILSGAPIFPDRPGVTLKGIAEGGWRQTDLSLVRRDIKTAIRETVVGENLPQRARRNLGRLEAANQRGLFDGVYPQAQTLSLKNWIVPRLLRQHPDWTDQQIMGQAATEVNKAFSTLGDFQTVLKNPFLQHLTRNLIFSTNEAEALLRGSGSILLGSNKRLWATFYGGGALFLATVANLVHMASTALETGRPEPLPLDRYSPVKRDDRSPIGVTYSGKFLSPDAPFGGEGGRGLLLDTVGQMDTAFRLLDPVGFIKARMNVLPRAVANQLTGSDYFDNPIDTVGPKGIVSRGMQAATDLYEPIGAGQARGALGLNPPAHEPVGTAGSVVQASGVNLRPETLADAVSGGGYAKLAGVQQFKAIPSESWRIMGEQEAFAEDVAQGRNVYEWRQSIERDLRKQLAGMPAGQMQVEINRAVESHPLYRAYLELRNDLRTDWVAQHPKDAIKLWNDESLKPWDEQLWTPTAEQRDMMISYMDAAP